MKKIVWTQSAARDLRRIFDYIAADSEVCARAMIDEIFESIERLPFFPKSGRVVPEVRNEHIREIIIGSYRLIYDIKNEAIRILVVIHGAKILKTRRL